MLAQPTTYYQVVSLAKLHEQKMTTLHHSLKNMPSKSTGLLTPHKTTSYNSTYLLPPNKNNTNLLTPIKAQSLTNTTSSKSTMSLTGSSVNDSTSNNPAYKRFTVIELRAKIEKGLCYYYDKKYHPQHKCKTCFLLVGQDEIEELLYQEGNKVVSTEGEQEEQLNTMDVISEISMNALSGQFHPNTLRVGGKVCW